jgi:hypothetical protein
MPHEERQYPVTPKVAQFGYPSDYHATFFKTFEENDFLLEASEKQRIVTTEWSDGVLGSREVADVYGWSKSQRS